MVVHCDTVLGSPEKVYQPGDVIYGRVFLAFEERTLIKALGIKISGFASTNWTKPVKKGKQKKNGNEIEVEKSKSNIIYENREDYIATTHYFIGSDAATTKIIESGEYLYNFSFFLPTNCPSEFESICGHIRYELQVFIVYPESKQTCCIRRLHVMRPLDLGKLKNVNDSYDVEFLEKKSFVKFWHRPLQLQLNIPKRGFVPGENVSIYVKVLNYDLVELIDITFKLNLVSTFIGLLKNKAKLLIDRTNLSTIVHSLCGKNGDVIQHIENVVIPKTPPTLSLTECRCIQISYEIEVDVSSAQKRRQIKGILPLTIGTISAQNKLTTMPREITASAPVLPTSQVVRSAHEFSAFQNATAPVLDSSTSITSKDPISSVGETGFMVPKFHKTPTPTLLHRIVE